MAKKQFYAGMPDYIERLNELGSAAYSQIQADWNAPVDSVKAILNQPMLAAVATSGKKNDVGLGNVDNTADKDKPISTALAAALSGKADAVAMTTALSGKQAALGFTPVQQGTGVGQSSNAVKIGWSSTGRLKATVDATDMGHFAMEGTQNNFSALQGFNGRAQSNNNTFDPSGDSWRNGAYVGYGAFGGGLSLVDSGAAQGGAIWVQGAQMYFGTGAAGAAVTSCFLIAPSQLLPAADNAKTLGNAGYRWNTVYAGSGTINTSDANHKTAVGGMSAAELTWAGLLAAEIGTYQFLDAVAEKGADGARMHCGMTVQRAIELGKAAGLDPMRYAFICYDQWDDEWEETADPAGDIVRSVEQPVMETITVPFREVQIVDGNPVLTELLREEQRPAVEYVPLRYPDGTPVIEASPALTDAEGNQIEPAREVALTYPMPLMEMVEQRFTRRLKRAAGGIYSFRTEQLGLFIARGLSVRLNALEAPATL